MQEEVVEGGVERRIVIGMIVSSQFLARVAPFWEREPLRSRWSNLAAEWCVQHFKQRNEAPGRDIMVWFERWSRQTGEAETVRTMDLFIRSLDDEYSTQPNVETLLDEAEQLLTEVRLERLYDQGRAALRIGDVKIATETAQAFKPVKLRAPPMIDVLRDRDAQERALESRREPLIKYPGGVGQFYDTELALNSFVAYFGVPKGMKSYLQEDNAWQAMLQRIPTLYFQVGDMTQDQIIGRFNARAMGRPQEPGIVRIPRSMSVGANYAASVESESVNYPEPAQKSDLDRYQRYAGKTLKKYLQLRCYPTGTASMLDIESDVAQCEMTGFRPKVIVIDYLENLAPFDRRAPRDMQVAETWSRTRALSERGYLVITASQTNKEGFKARVMTRSNFRGSLMTLATVTAAIGINQTDEEKDIQVARLNFMVKRAGFFRETKCCVVASCLARMQPFTLSWWQQ